MPKNSYSSPSSQAALSATSTSMNLNPAFPYLDRMTEQRNLNSSEFIKNTVLRKRVSSSLFVGSLAISYRISLFANASFVCIPHNDTPIL